MTADPTLLCREAEEWAADSLASLLTQLATLARAESSRL